MTHKVFIDGEAGTTGLQIRERLANRAEIDLIRLPEALRKDAAARKDALNAADAVILCLPDEAAIEAVSLIENPNVAVIDASTAHRTHPDWTFGFPEMDNGAQRDLIRKSRRISNPGCHSTGFIALVRPLVMAGLVPPFFPITVTSLTGYSGGGKSMIAEYESGEGQARIYATGLAHKHVPEMTLYSAMETPPIFSPTVAKFAQGLVVEVPLHLWALPDQPDLEAVHEVLSKAYLNEPFVHVAPREDSAETKQVNGDELASTNTLAIHVFGNEDYQQANLVAVFDNLGKGASGAAVQNLNLVLGLDETTGLS